MWTYVCENAKTHGIQKRAVDSLELELQDVTIYSTGVLRSKPGSAARAASVLTS